MGISKERAVEIVEGILGTSSRIEVDLNDPSMEEIRGEINKSRVRLTLSGKGIIAEMPKSGSTVIFSRLNSMGARQADGKPVVENKAAPKSRPSPKRHQHTYVPPAMSKDIMDALLDDASHVLWFKGPTGTGKTVLAQYLAHELGMELFQINCHSGMDDTSFFGEKTVEIDEATGQNHVVFEEGVAVKAMRAGLDEDGNEVGKAGLLFIDEAGAMPMGSIVLNRLLESDDPRRTITLEHQSGRVIRSHSKFRIILSANNGGRGATTMAEAMHTAQMDALDISLIDRIFGSFKFGYNKLVEKHIAMEKLGDDRIVSQLLKFRDAIRDQIRAGKLSTPFSTRSIIQIADAYRIYGDLAKSVYYTTFEFLLPEEMPVYNEISVAQGLGDILKKMIDPDIDYM